MVLIYACGGTSIQIAALQAHPRALIFAYGRGIIIGFEGDSAVALPTRLIFNDAND